MKSTIANKIPLFQHLKKYQSKDFKKDLWAGLTVGTVLIPQGMAYAMLAGMPPEYGLYGGLIPLLIYALLGSSTKLSIGPVAISAILIFSGISALATPGTPEYIQLVILAGLMIGILQTLLGLLRLGFIANFLSHPVIVGFTSAAALIIIVSQLGDFLGMRFPNSEHIYEKLFYTVQNLNDINLLSFGIGVVAIVIIITLKKIKKSIPGPLIVVLLGLLLSYFFNLEAKAVDIVQDIPEGLPGLSNIELDWDTIRMLIPTVLTVTLIGIVESIGIAKALESKHRDHYISANQELLALGLSKTVGSFFQAIPTSGSFSRSAINSETGGQTGISSIISAFLVLITLLFLTPIFYYLPKSILAGIILVSVMGLFDFKEVKYLWKVHRPDFVMMMVTFFSTLIFGIEIGVLCGVILSILTVLYKSSLPNIVEMGNIPGTQDYRNISRFDNLDRDENLAIIRFDDQLYFGNTPIFKETIIELSKRKDTGLKQIILDGSGINRIDSTGLHALKEMDLFLKSQHIDLHLCGVNGPVRDRLYNAGLLKEKDKHHLNVHDAVCRICDEKLNEARNYNAMQSNIETDLSKN